MNYYVITGTSRGIGKALAEKLLTNKNNLVLGISRTQTIYHENYKHFNIDFYSLDEVPDFEFPDADNTNKVVLINNSGVINEILRVGKLSSESIIGDYNVNIVAPTILSNNFIKAYQNLKNERIILNISSGAGRHAIDAWSTYCASKSALDMFSLTISEEQKHYMAEKRIKVFSVAPGVVDTAMQDQIRDTKPEEFSKLDRFINLKNNNELTSPNVVAEKLLYIINNSNKINDVVIDVREM